MKRLAVLTFLTTLPEFALAERAGHVPPSPYAGQESLAIKSLSQDDITELRRGGGWGLAKAAELNGVPGPAHLLELKDPIALTAAQVSAIQEIFDRMRERAIVEGERLIVREQALDDAFRTRNVTRESLRQMLTAIENSCAIFTSRRTSPHPQS